MAYLVEYLFNVVTLREDKLDNRWILSSFLAFFELKNEKAPHCVTRPASNVKRPAIQPRTQGLLKFFRVQSRTQSNACAQARKGIGSLIPRLYISALPSVQSIGIALSLVRD